MTKCLLSLFLFSVLFNQNAFARHAYRSEDCKMKDLSLVYKGNYPVGGMYGISRDGQEEDETALPLFDGEYQNTLEDANVIFTEMNSKILEETPPVSECGFEHTEWKSEKVISIDLITDDASKKLGLKAGEKFTFICEESTDYPDDSECE